MIDVGASVALAKLEQAGALRPTGLTLPSDISPAEFEAVGTALSAMREALQWAYGDFIVHGEALWGEESYQYVDSLKISETSKLQYARVATRIPEGRRLRALSWSHHREVAVLEPDDQDRLLRSAAALGWSRDRLLEEVRELRPRTSEPATGYVVEAVLDAAEVIWESADADVSAGRYCVASETMEDLGRALGKL